LSSISEVWRAVRAEDDEDEVSVVSSSLEPSVKGFSDVDVDVDPCSPTRLLKTSNFLSLIFNPCHLSQSVTKSNPTYAAHARQLHTLHLDSLAEESLKMLCDER
jgi:hypothetical protein